MVVYDDEEILNDAEADWQTFISQLPTGTSIPTDCNVDYPQNVNLHLAMQNPSRTCDLTMASYCDDPGNKDTGICACINNSLVCPTLTSTSCRNNDYAYKPYADTADCKGSTMCINNEQIFNSPDAVISARDSCKLQLTKSSPTATGNGSTAASTAPAAKPNHMYIIIIVIIVIIIVALSIYHFDKATVVMNTLRGQT